MDNQIIAILDLENKKVILLLINVKLLLIDSNAIIFAINFKLLLVWTDYYKV